MSFEHVDGVVQVVAINKYLALQILPFPMLTYTNMMMTLCLLVIVFTEHADLLAREVVRLVDHYAADNAATVLTDYCKGNENVSGVPGPHNITGLLYFISAKIPEMTCQDFVDLVDKHVSGKKGKVVDALM